MRKLGYVLTLSLVLALGFVGLVKAQPPVAEDRPWLGVQVEAGEAGLRVAQVVASSPAALAGIQADDLITAVDGVTVSTFEALVAELNQHQPGDTVILSITRGAESLEIEITLGNYPASAETRPFGRGGGEIVVMGAASPRLGVQVTPNEQGLEITAVMPMADSDFQLGDIITKINGESVLEKDTLEILAALAPDTPEVEVTVLRGGEEITLTATLVWSPMGGFGTAHAIPAMPFPGIMLGVQFHTLDAAFAANLGLEVSEGALILTVLPGSVAETAGLQAGDIITAVDGIAVDSEHTLPDLLGDYEVGDVVTLTVLRAGQATSVEVTIDAPAMPGQPGGFFFEQGVPPGIEVRPFDFDIAEGAIDLGGLLAELGDQIPTDGAPFSVTCTDEAGNVVFSFQFSGSIGSADNSISFGTTTQGLDLSQLDCEVNTDPVPAGGGI